MWVCTRLGFISIVQDDKNKDILKVRARKREHLASLFPDIEIVETEFNDYRFRVFARRSTVAVLLANLVMADREHPAEVTYTNFKDSVKDNELHDLYAGFWTDHHRYQEGEKSRGYRARRAEPHAPFGVIPAAKPRKQSAKANDLQAWSDLIVKKV